jgi:hypothetical protein
MRAFACTALLRASTDAETRSSLIGGLDQTLIQLIDSLEFAGADLCGRAAALTAWLIIECEAEPDGFAFLGIALLWFGLNQRPAISDEVVISLAEWISAQEKVGASHGLGASQWLLRTTFPGDRYSEHWERLGNRFAGLELGKRSLAAREWISLIGTELAGKRAASA